MRMINVYNQTGTVKPIVRPPTWPIAFPNFRYTVPYVPEQQLRFRQVAPVISQNVMPPAMPHNPVAYGAVNPLVIRVSTTDHLALLPNLFIEKSSLQRPPFSNATSPSIIESIIGDHEKILELAYHKQGSRFLQRIYCDGNEYVRQKLSDYFLRIDVFTLLCDDVFANFLLQKLIEKTGSSKHKWICLLLETNLMMFCFGRYSCRVVQRAFECFDTDMRLSLSSKLEGKEKQLSMNEHGNHVLQKMMICLPFFEFSGIVKKFLATPEDFFDIATNKYGCRIIQLAIERLEREMSNHSEPVTLLLDDIISLVLEKCYEYSAHRFANYIIQHIITADNLEKHRDTVICGLLNKLLSLSQEKYASHVIEKALKHAPPHLLAAMMKEIFDGYESGEDGHDALDILMFDQYGNYVIQTLLRVVIEVKKQRTGDEKYFKRLSERIIRNQYKLAKFSSGKRILAKLSTVIPNNNISQDEDIDPLIKTLIVPEKFR